MNNLYNGDPYLAHSAKGTSWGKHKYIDIVNGRYIYKTNTTASTKTNSLNTSSKSVASKNAKVISGKTSVKANTSKAANKTSRSNKGILTSVNNAVVSALSANKSAVTSAVSSTAQSTVSAAKDALDDHSTNSTKKERQATRDYVSGVKTSTNDIIDSKTKEYTSSGKTVPSKVQQGMDTLSLLADYAVNAAGSEDSGESDSTKKGRCDEAQDMAENLDEVVHSTPVSKKHYSDDSGSYTTYVIRNSEGNPVSISVSDSTAATYRATTAAAKLTGNSTVTSTISVQNQSAIAVMALFDMYDQ